MRTSTFKVQLTQGEEMDRKPAEQIITAVLIFFSRLGFSFSSEIFQHVMHKNLVGIA